MAFIPHDIVQEALGCFTLTGSEDEQVEIAEQLASTYYSNLDDLVSIVKGYAKRNTFTKELTTMKKSDFFRPYWSN